MDIIALPISELSVLEEIGSNFRAETEFIITPPLKHDGDFTLTEKSLKEPFYKDYDALPGNRPTDWLKEFDLSKWLLFAAYKNDTAIGGGLLALDTPGIDMLQGRRDLAVLWDIRVRERYRHQGVGTALFEYALRQAKLNDCNELHIETQTNNPAAVRFYLSKGCRLIKAVPHAYPDCPDETMLIFSFCLLKNLLFS